MVLLLCALFALSSRPRLKLMKLNRCLSILPKRLRTRNLFARDEGCRLIKGNRGNSRRGFRRLFRTMKDSRQRSAKIISTILRATPLLRRLRFGLPRPLLLLRRLPTPKNPNALQKFRESIQMPSTRLFGNANLRNWRPVMPNVIVSTRSIFCIILEIERKLCTTNSNELSFNAFFQGRIRFRFRSYYQR